MHVVKIKDWLTGERRVVKIKEHLAFVENLAHFVLKIEFLLTVLSNFEKKAVLGDSAS